MKIITPNELEEKVYLASKAAFKELIAANPSELFYTFGLWTDDSLQFLYPAANTEERLTTTVLDYRENVDHKYNTVSSKAGLRWSYGDWGFFPADGEEHFDTINEELNTIFELEFTDDEFESLIFPLINAIVTGFKRLDHECFFGDGAKRSNVTLLIVGDLQQRLVNTCAIALNPKEVSDKYVKSNPEDNDE